MIRIQLLGVLIALGMTLTAALPAASVGLLDGQVVEGDSLVFGSDATLQIGGKTLKLGDCDWLDSGGEVNADTAGSGVLLLDGSWLPVSALAAAGQDSVQIVSPLGTMTLELGQVIAWGEPAWVLAKATSNADQVQVGEEVYRGEINTINNGELEINVTGIGPVAVPLEQVKGMRLRGAITPPKGVVLAPRLDPAQPPVFVRPGPELRLAAVPEVVVDLPPGRMRVHGGRRVWLADLTPSAVQEEGAFGVTWPHSVNENLDGGPISLRGQRIENGLVVHSKAELTWQLKGQFTALSVLIGIEDSVGQEGDCGAALLVDGKVAWEATSVRGGEEPIPVRLDLSAAKTLTLRVSFGERYDIGDHLTLADAWLLRSETATP